MKLQVNWWEGILGANNWLRALVRDTFLQFAWKPSLREALYERVFSRFHVINLFGNGLWFRAATTVVAQSSPIRENGRGLALGPVFDMGVSFFGDPPHKMGFGFPFGFLSSNPLMRPTNPTPQPSQPL